jgi:thermolysin
VIHEREGLRRGAARGSGVGALGERRALDVFQTADGYELRDETRNIRTFTAEERWTVPGTLVRSDDPDAWDQDVFGAGAAVDAHASAAAVTDYLERALGRHGWDGEGGTLRLVVHAGPRVANAFWDGRHAIFGDGDGASRLPLAAALDVVGHEIFHGVTDSEVGLIYEGQPGALSESLSDLFGSFIEQDAGLDGGDWLFGGAVADPPFRDLSRPWTTGNPAHMRDYHDLALTPDEDMGGVHVNCTIPTYAAVLLADGGKHHASGVAVSALGRDVVRDVWWRAVQLYVAPRASFAAFARATVLAAQDLHGEDAPEVAEVRRAWRAVGVVPR